MENIIACKSKQFLCISQFKYSNFIEKRNRVADIIY